MPPKGKNDMMVRSSPRKVTKKMKAIKDESLKRRLERILAAKTDECNWGAQQTLLKKWGLTERNQWGIPARLLHKGWILTYLSAPQIKKMGNLKDLAAKYGVSKFHDGKIWLDHPVQITKNLIHHVTRLPRIGEKVPMDMPLAEMMQKQLG